MSIKILFICSGNRNSRISPIVKNQGESLIRNGINVEYFLIIGTGVIGYLKNIPKLKRHLKSNNYDLIHSHYSYSGFVAGLATKLPIVSSLMGSDVFKSIIFHQIIRFFSKHVWRVTIVKSYEMKKKLRLNNSIVIPNGVNLNAFKEMNANEAKRKVNFDPKYKHIVWISNSGRFEKNYQLALESMQLLDNKKIKFHTIFGIEHSKVSIYLHAADLLLLTSLWEGSPNIIKESMVSGCPIVSTDVGDVKTIFGNTEGCYITTYDPKDVAEKIKIALDFSSIKMRTKGRNRIIDLGLDSETLASKIIFYYNDILRKSKLNQLSCST